MDRWDDTRIAPGADWRQEIGHALASAKVAVLLISADFLASDFIANHELQPLLEQAEQQGTVILLVILSPCLFAEILELSSFQPVNDPASPVKGLSGVEQEQVFVNVTRIILGFMLSSILPKPT